ncbi:MAG: acyl-CoA thioesterase [Pseudomonadota bacterium]
MNLYLKFFVLIVKRLFPFKKIGITDLCKTKFMVGLLDLDLNFHMNNGRFFSVMDLGRFDLMFKTGYFFKLIGNGYYPVVLSESIVFKKSLNLYNFYEVHTEIDSWDDTFFYMAQKFYYKGQIVASANVRACFKKRGKRGIVKPLELFEFIGEDHYENKLTQLSKKQIELDEVLLPRRATSK